jgi:prepilin-type N-terminal cleavage/methylation domain-containing protein
MDKNNAGFTLIEIVLVVFVLGLILFTIAPLFNSITLIKRANSNLMSAISIAEDALEQLRGSDFNIIKGMSDESTTIVDNYFKKEILLYHISDNEIKVTVTIKWDEMNRKLNKERVYEVVSYITKNGLSKYLNDT